MSRIAVVLTAVLAGCGPPGPPRFADVVRVELVRAERGAKEIRAVVKGPALGPLLAALDGLKPADPCRCLHTDRAVFHRRDGSAIEADFCNHCLDVRSTVGHYQMPPAFFRAFEAQLASP